MSYADLAITVLDVLAVMSLELSQVLTQKATVEVLNVSTSIETVCRSLAVRTGM